MATKQEDGKIKLGKIELKMGEKVVTLTIEQARELSALLKGLFGDDSTKIVHVPDYWYPRPWYFGSYKGNQPSYTGNQWQVYCTSVASNSGAIGNTITFSTVK